MPKRQVDEVADTDEKRMVEEAAEIIRTRTESTTAAAARRGISYTHMLRRIKRGDVEVVEWGSGLRVWIEV